MQLHLMQTDLHRKYAQSPHITLIIIIIKEYYYIAILSKNLCRMSKK